MNFKEKLDVENRVEEIFFAGGCLWGVQEFIRHLPGVVSTEAGRANGSASTTNTEYDGYAECVKTTFDPKQVSLETLIHHLFEIIDPYSVNQQGEDVGEKYRTGIYSEHESDLVKATACIQQLEQVLNKQNDTQKKIAVEVLPLTNYVASDEEHQDRLTLHPNDYCHIPLEVLHKYKHA